jgi:hypothetical protein
MSRPLQHLAVIVEDFAPGSSAQHLLDRLLAGYPHDGQLRQRLAPRIVLHDSHADTDAESLQLRVTQSKLELSQTIADAVQGADAAVVVWQGGGNEAKPEMLELVLRQLPQGAACFVHGLTAKSQSDAAALQQIALSRSIRLASGTVAATTFRLPEWRLRPGTRLSESLVVVQGESPLATLHGIYALLPDLARSREGFHPVRSVRFLSGEAVWHAGARGEWSWPLLRGALSRTNTLQGDPMKDGRTQDIVQLGLVQKLAQNPRCWLTQHGGELRSCILALDGVVTDLNLALQPRGADILSTQLYRPPGPNYEHYCALTYAIEMHLLGSTEAKEVWSGKPDAIAAWWEALANASARPGDDIASKPW